MQRLVTRAISGSRRICEQIIGASTNRGFFLIAIGIAIVIASLGIIATAAVPSQHASDAAISGARSIVRAVALPDSVRHTLRRILPRAAAPGYMAVGGGSAAATVATDKLAYLPGSHVVATGTGWLPNVIVTLVYTELSTTASDGVLHAPVQVFVSTDANGNFSTAGDPNADFVTDTSHQGTVTLQVTATGQDATGATVSVQSATFTNGVTVTTDQTKYFVGQIMIISGAGFTGGGTANVSVQRPDQIVESVSQAIKNDGTFSVSYTPPAQAGRYKITATDGTFTAKTATTAADAIKSDFLQCANNDGKQPDNLGKCNWISSILQSSDAKYFEGMSTLQHLIFDQIPATAGNVHTVIFHIDATKAGSHAYDFLSGWDQALAAAAAIDPAETLMPDMSRTTLGNNNACENFGDPSANPQPSLEALCQTLRLSTNSNVTTAAIPTQTNADVGGAVSVATAIANYATHFGSNVGARLYASSAIANATLTFNGYNSPTGDQQASYTLHWTSASPSILIEFAAHIAQGIDTLGAGIGYGAGLGASNISGGPYHVSIDTVDGASLGSQDNQLKGADILVPPATPTVTTQVRNASNTDITNQTVEVGTVVHDHATVDTGNSLNPIPSGSTFTFHRYTTFDCTGVSSVDQTVSVPSGAQTGSADSSTFTPTAGSYSYLADFHSGNTAVVKDASGTCEPFKIIAPATTLTTKSVSPGTTVEPGTQVTIIVTETNTGNSPLTNVSVTGTGCTTWTGGASTLAAGASTDFTCQFTPTIANNPNAWTADGHGTDELGNPVPSTGEHTSGSVNVLNVATTLTTKSVSPGTSVEAGTLVTITVTETNTGSGALTGVNVTGSGCTTWTGGASTLAAGASTDFTCQFTPTAAGNPNAWSADGHGTDQLGNPAPSTGEHTSGTVHVVAPATTLTTKSVSPGTSVEAGTLVTITVTETNTGNGTLTGVNVTGSGCATWTGGASTLAAGASTDFTCQFTPTAAGNPNAWSADGHGTDELGNPAPSTNEHTSGNVHVVAPATTLTTKSVSPGTSVEAGTLVTITVTETNTGNGTLTGVNVTGSGCATWTGGASTLAAGASTDFTCQFTPTAAGNPNAWSADGHGTDELGNPAPSTNEHTSGNVHVVAPATTLTTKSVSPGTSVEAGTLVTITVTETNTGNGTLTGVNVTGSGCATWTGGASTLAAGASTDFTCQFTPTAAGNPNAWSADGHGTDELGNPAPSTNEHTSGNVHVVAPATTLTTQSVSPGTTVLEGTLVTITVRETNTGNGTLTNVSVTGTGCTSWTGGASTLAAGAFTDFTCSFTPPVGSNGWTADGHGTDELGNPVPSTGEHTAGTVIVQPKPTLTIIKTIKGTSTTFGYHVTGAETLSPPTTNLTPPDNGSAQFGPVIIEIGQSTISEDALPSDWTLTDVQCKDNGSLTGTPGPLDNNGIPTNWTFTAAAGSNIVCSYVNNQVVLTTRTQGFWATHTELANEVWGGNGTTYPASGVGGPVINSSDPSPSGSPDSYLCGIQITASTNPEENVLMGGFWASISQLSDPSLKGKKAQRLDIDQARMQMLQQYLAAVLNVYMFGSGPVDLAAARTAYCGNSASAIQTQIGILGAFNQKGDSGVFTPGASATPSVSKSQADIDAWDIPKYAGLSDEESAPTLALIKQVAGVGTATATDFTLKATCSAGACTIGSFTSGAGGFSSKTFTEGTYTLTDTASGANNSGSYTKGTWSCVGTGSFSLGPTLGGTATLFIGQGAVVSCTITNTAP